MLSCYSELSCQLLIQATKRISCLKRDPVYPVRSPVRHLAADHRGATPLCFCLGEPSRLLDCAVDLFVRYLKYLDCKGGLLRYPRPFPRKAKIASQQRIAPELLNSS